MFLDMLKYYNLTKECNMNIIYGGPLWEKGIEGIGETLKRRFLLDDLPKNAACSVFSVFVEQMHNMLMYSEDMKFSDILQSDHPESSKGYFVVGVHKSQYFIQSGNIVREENAHIMRERIDYLNTLDKAQLRQYYKERIKCEDDNPHSQGAGLGLIEIARRASKPIEYDFKPLEKDLTFFSMFVTIG